MLTLTKRVELIYRTRACLFIRKKMYIKQAGEDILVKVYLGKDRAVVVWVDIDVVGSLKTKGNKMRTKTIDS
jgi:hypothetical protein